MLANSVLSDLTDFAGALADVAREMLRPGTGRTPQTEIKADRTLVTSLDRAIERRLSEVIAARFPHDGIWGEEYGRTNPGAALQWIVDPIDGTAQFIAGIPTYSTLVALAIDGVPVIGVMDFPATGDRWTGCHGRPTRHNGEICTTRSCDSLADAMMSSSSPDFYSDTERPVLDALRGRTRWRIYGGASMSYGLLAAGRTDLACDTGFKVYDFSSFRPIIEGAGGVITDWAGQPLTTESGPQVLAAGSPARHAEALAVIRQCRR